VKGEVSHGKIRLTEKIVVFSTSRIFIEILPAKPGLVYNNRFVKLVPTS